MHRKTLKGKIFKLPLLQEHCPEFVRKIEKQGWLHLFKKDFGFNKLEVVNFFVNCKVTKGTVTSLIGEVKIKFNAKTIGSILRIPSKGFDQYSKIDWP